MSTLITKNVETKKGGSKRIIKMNIESYNSAGEVARDCDTREITDTSFYDMRRKRDYDRWEGVSSYEEALRLMRDGFQPSVEKLKNAAKISKMGDGRRFKFVNDIVGSAPVVPLAMMGIPNSMVDTRFRPIKCKVIDVYFDMTCSAGTDADDIIRNGQKVLGAVLELEAQGYRFNLYCVQSYYDSDSADVLAVRVKSSNQPLDLKRISFPLTHPAFFRVIGFDWYSKTPKGKYRSGYGHAFSYDYNQEQMTDIGKQMFGDNALYISAVEILRKDQEHIKELFENAGQNKR